MLEVSPSLCVRLCKSGTNDQGIISIDDDDDTPSKAEGDSSQDALVKPARGHVI